MSPTSNLVIAALAAVIGTAALPSAANAHVGFRFSIGNGYVQSDWQAGPRHVQRHHLRRDHQRRHWQPARACHTEYRVERIFDRRGRLVRIIKTPIEICRRNAWR